MLLSSCHCHSSVNDIMKFHIIILVLCCLFPLGTMEGDGPVSSDDHHIRIRRLATPSTRMSRLSFDFNYLMPIPVMGSMDVLGIVEVPLTVTVTNDTFNWTPISLPYFVMSAHPPSQSPPLPIVSKVFSDPIDAINYLTTHHSNYVHHIIKRHSIKSSMSHRRDIFESIVAILNDFGINGSSCIHRFVCQLHHSPLLIETIIHEIVQLVLTFPETLFQDGSVEEMDSYIESANLGRNSEDCQMAYDCPFDLFTLIGD